MSSEGVNSLAQRVLSLEDIIRQQEQTISAVLQRLRDVEQYAAAESRSREQAQQQLQAAFGNHNGSTAETLNRMQALLQSHNDRLSTLQAEVQGQGAALRGTNDKHDVAFREMEKRLQADLSAAHQRAQTGETASAEAMRALQAQLQSMANVTQAVETRNHDDLVALQQQISAELAMQRQRCDNLESAIRDALRDVHGSLSGDVRSAGAQQRSDLEAAVQRINQELEALSQRTRIDMNQLHSTEQTDVSDLRRRIGDLEYGVREAVQAATNGLAHEVAQVAQHSQMQDKRQETAHQAILQELAKHDTQLETVDLNWRASVTDLGAKMREDVAAAQQRSVAGDQALQSQVGALQDRLVEMTNKLRGDLTALATSIQENCVRPLQEAHHTLSVQGQRMSRVADDYASMQDYLTTFAAHVDEDVGQSKQIMEAAVRAAHSDLLERINLISMPNTLHQDSDMRAEVNRSLAKLWEDAKGVFLTQRSLDDIQTQLMTLESAVRVELCALAERLNEVWRTVDKHRIGELRAAQQPITPASVTGMAPEQSSSHHFAASSAAISTVTTPVASSFTRTHRNQVSAVLTKASKSTAELPTTGATATTAAPWSSKAAKTSRASSVTAKVEEIYKDSDEQNERLRQHEEDIKALWASLQRLHTAQTPELSKPASSTQWNNVSTIHPGAAAGAEADRVSIEVQSAAREAAESAKAAESAQDECVRAANELRLAVQRVSVLEESLQMQLTEAKVMLSAATPKQQAQPPQPLPRKTDKPLAASFAAKTTPPYSSPPKQLVAKGEAETPKGEEETQKGKRRPQREAATPKGEAETAKGEAATPKGEEETPKGEEETAKGEAATPKGEEETAKGEAATPKGEEETQKGRAKSDPKGEEETAKGEAATPKGEAATPKGEEETPKGEEETAKGEAATPKGEEETAKGEAETPKGEAAKDVKTGVSGAAASITPRAANRPTAHTSLSAEALATPADDLVEVPGMLTGEVFIVRKDKIDATSSASVRRRPATAGTATFLPRPVASSGALVRPTLGDSVVPEPSSHRGSSSEVLLPTHQFVRKREYSNFKDFTKREIDAIWVELLSMRRTHGLSKEEVLLYISQSKEQILGTVLNVVQQQEKEVLGILGNIKTQLTELDRNPDAVREIRVFPVDSGQNLEKFVRSLSGYLKAVPVAAQAEPLSSAATAAGQPQSGVRKGVSRPATNRPAARRTGASTTATTTPLGQSLRPTERGNESGACTSLSSACSSLPVQPQLISPMVKRRASQPTLRPELQEAVCVSLEVSSPKSDSSSQRKPSHCPAPKHNFSASQQHARQYATDAVVHPQSARPARRLSEPECVVAQHQLASISSTTVQVSQAKSSPLSSEHASVGRQQLLGSRLAAASAGPGPSGGSDPCCYASPQADHTAPPPDQLSSPSSSAVRGCTGGDLKCFLKESKSPRNSTGSSFHLNPLQGIVGGRFPSPTVPGVRRAATATAVLATATPSRSIDSESQLLEADQRQPYTRLPRCPLRGHSLSLLTTSQAEAPDAPLPKDTSFEKYESVNICQESETSCQSVGSMRPLRSGVQHRSVDSMDGTSARGGISAACVREPRHLYERQTPMPGQYRSLSAQFPTPMAQPHPRGYSPARDGSSTSVSIDTNPPRRPAQVHTTAVSGTIRLGPYRKPPGDDTNNLTIASRTSISSRIDHTPHVNVSGGRNDDRSTRSMHSALQSLDCSTPNQPHSSATMPSNVVPVRVLDNPVNRSDDSSSLDRSLVIVHPYNKP
ncbi:hypothetical_protein (plasmid) [Leishmania braziliensis MHOM/BR/75/M2904]|uniref:Hypothetical_protein n=1 Tax=Leishmania braziliensis MHOM/BR/75/M2904 TaxID=420245 RepID=A0A3P3Z890_LEIBR|nr:hypothetical_protein [Leishmania braziliensis MHOM/BR/75/M2904]